MIKEKELAIKFMRGKAVKVKEFCDIEYFTVEDEKAIVDMDNEKLKTAWDRLVCNIAFPYDRDVSGLGADACIFCYYNHEDCNNCAYSIQHGGCFPIDNPDSDYRRIISQLSKEDIDSFSTQFYRDLLKSIQEENDD